MNRYLLALNGIEQLKPQLIKAIENSWPDLSEFFRLNTEDLINLGFSFVQANAITKIDLKTLDKTIEWQNNTTKYILDWHSPHYPHILKQISNPPPILFAHGKLKTLNSDAIAIVGTRKPTMTGIKNTQLFSKLLSDYLTIVSGLALGIDGHAHNACLNAEGSTIAILACGIDQVYPRRHQYIANKIVDNGLILSEFPFNTPPLPRQFPRRNRIISGLCLGTLITEAAIRSGSLITANYALEQNREVFAIPGAINNKFAAGGNLLIKQGAHLVTRVEDILEGLSINYQQSKKHKKKMENRLATDYEKLVKCVGYELTTLDDIKKTCGLSVDTILSQLVELELLGMIQAVPGGYMRC
jgi:DNA processing protein